MTDVPEGMPAMSEDEARRMRVVAAMGDIPDDCLETPVTLEDFLIVLVQRLQQAGVLTCYVLAAGSGDEGEIESPSFTFKEGADDSDEVVDQLSDELDELWEPMFARYPFNWQDGDGGELTLFIDTTTGECDWTASAPRMMVLDGDSQVFTVADGKIVDTVIEEEAQSDDTVAPCDE